MGIRIAEEHPLKYMASKAAPLKLCKEDLRYIPHDKIIYLDWCQVQAKGAYHDTPNTCFILVASPIYDMMMATRRRLELHHAPVLHVQ